MGNGGSSNGGGGKGTTTFRSLSSAWAKGRGKGALAQALAGIEAAPDDAPILALLDQAYRAKRAADTHVVGLTGPPGVGKSTLLGALMMRWRARGQTVGVIAVDPSSRRSGGALLGDRIRLATDPEDSGIFVRSMAARERLGGLASLTVPAMVLMRALFDIVVVESVGVGQSETEIAAATDTVVLCIQPGSGDSLQFMKAGIVEIPDIIVVNKADMGDPADRARADIESALHLGGRKQAWTTPVLLTSSTKGDGIDALVDALDGHRTWLLDSGAGQEHRDEQASAWVVDAVRERFGTDGLKRAGTFGIASGESPFNVLSRILKKLELR